MSDALIDDTRVRERYVQVFCEDCCALFGSEAAYAQHHIVDVQIWGEQPHCLSEAEMRQIGMRRAPAGIWWEAPSLAAQVVREPEVAE